MSWNGEVNKAFKISFVEGLSKLSERPGEFLRKLDFLIRTSKPENVKVVYAALKGILPKVSNKVLFEVYTHFEKRNTPKTNRTIMVKGARKPTTLPDLPAISEKNIMHIKNLIMDTLLDKFETLDDLGDMIAELQDALEQPVLVDSDFRGYVIGQFIERYEDDDDGVQ